MDVSPVAGQLQLAVEKLALQQLKAQGAGVENLIASAPPGLAGDPNLGRLLDVSV